MLIGIDGNEINVANRVGVGRYAHELINYLFKIISKFNASGKKSDEVCIYLKDSPAYKLPPQKPFWRYKVFGPNLFWTQTSLPLRLFFDREKPQVFFTPSHYAPRFSPVPCVISLMDLSFIHFPEMFNKKDLYQLKSWTDYSVKKAAKILTISNFSKSEIVNHYGISADKVVVTYPGFNREQFGINTEGIKEETKQILDNFRNKYKLAQNYVLFVGTLQPRKNIESLIKAFAILAVKDKDLQLTIAGKPGWMYQNIFETVRKVNLPGKINFIQFVEDQDLPNLYRQAKCFVLPSLYEGFGLPVVEAMACGCPVVVSKNSSLPEITGHAAILINPWEIEDLAHGVGEAIYNKERRKNLIKNGLSRVKLFSWEDCAQKTYAILKEVACSNGFYDTL